MKKGKHLYKFIIDGKWKQDPTNNETESDGYNGNLHENITIDAYGKSTVYFSTNNFANISAVNAPWNFMSSIVMEIFGLSLSTRLSYCKNLELNSDSVQQSQISQCLD
jgi:hypothetical protein